MTDRVPIEVLENGAIRYGIYNADGTLNRYEYIKLEDAATVLGSAFNKANVLPDPVKALLALTQSDPQIADAFTKLSDAALRKTIRTTVSELAVGGEFTLNETINGTTTAVTFVKLKDNYEGSGRTLVVRKDAIASMAWNSGGTNAYSGSTLDTYLNSTYTGYLDSSVQSQLANVNIPYTVGNGNTTVTTIARKCFALSGTEYGFSTANMGVEGTAISYFSSNAKRIANYNGSAIGHHMRSPVKSNTNNDWYVITDGSFTNATVTSTAYARPAFTLPSNFILTSLDKKSLVDMAGNEFALPYARISTGSYVGSGTFGSSNKNNIPVPFTPELIFVMRKDSSAMTTYYSSSGSIAGFMFAIKGVNSVGASGQYSGEGSGSYMPYQIFTWNTNSVEWYLQMTSGGAANHQFNESGVGYIYAIFGR